MTVGIVGAGITGLATSYYLAERGVDHVVLEATDRPGGVIRSPIVDGKVLECGPQRGRMMPALRSLVSDLDIEDEVVEADGDLPLYVYADGKLREVPFDVSTFLTTDLLSWRGKARVFWEPFTENGREDELVGELLARKFGREAYENFVGPIFGGTYGSDPARMPAKYALSRVLQLERRSGSLLKPALKRAMSEGSAPAFSFEDGLERFPEALAEALAGHVRFETPVEEIRARDDGFTLVTPDEQFDVGDVVVTTPAHVTADLVRGIDEGSADALASLHYNPLALVHVEADTDAHGLGYQIRRDEDFRTLGVTWNASIFDRDGVYTCFLGGMKDPDLVSRPEEELGEIATREFEEILGEPAEVIDVTRLERAMPAYDTSWEAMDDVDLPAGMYLAANYAGGAGIPSRIYQAKRLAEQLNE